MEFRSQTGRPLTNRSILEKERRMFRFSGVECRIVDRSAPQGAPVPNRNGPAPLPTETGFACKVGWFIKAARRGSWQACVAEDRMKVRPIDEDDSTLDGAEAMWRERERKPFLPGTSFDFDPSPPQKDILGVPMVMENLPLDQMPKESRRLKLARVFSGFFRLSPEDRLRRRFYETVRLVTALLAKPSGMGTAFKRKPRKGATGRLKAGVSRVYHPYVLKPAFEFLKELPDELDAERRFLDRLLGEVLDKYANTLSAIRLKPFTFEADAKEQFYFAYKAEKLLRRITDPTDRFESIQEIYNSYFHARNYYFYSLVRREAMPDDNQLFMLFCCAEFFVSRLGWNGELLPTPNPRVVPTRTQLLYYALRDVSVLRRFKNDREFAHQLRETLKSFPASAY